MSVVQRQAAPHQHSTYHIGGKTMQSEEHAETEPFNTAAHLWSK